MTGHWEVRADAEHGGYIVVERTPGWDRTFSHRFYSKLLAELHADYLNRNPDCPPLCSGDSLPA